MSDLDDAVEAARGELVRRLLDTDERERMPAHVLVRVLGALQTEQKHLEPEPEEEDADPLEMVRNLPPERAAEVLGRLKGITSAQAATLLGNKGGENSAHRPESEPEDTEGPVQPGGRESPLDGEDVVADARAANGGQG